MAVSVLETMFVCLCSGVAAQWWHMDSRFTDISRNYYHRVSEFVCALCYQSSTVAKSSETRLNVFM